MTLAGQRGEPCRVDAGELGEDGIGVLVEQRSPAARRGHLAVHDDRRPHVAHRPGHRVVDHLEPVGEARVGDGVEDLVDDLGRPPAAPHCGDHVRPGSAGDACAPR